MIASHFLILFTQVSILVIQRSEGMDMWSWSDGLHPKPLVMIIWDIVLRVENAYPVQMCTPSTLEAIH